uniref:Uncharacterized protein n=1 Tax=Oryza barthii TaxID=65489 RepID=A0A0D3FDI4_9ORYZ
MCLWNCLAEGGGGIQVYKVVNNSDQDYSHLPELDLSVMLNQGTLHQSQDQLLINHTSPVSFRSIIDVYGRED